MNRTLIHGRNRIVPLARRYQAYVNVRMKHGQRVVSVRVCDCWHDGYRYLWTCLLTQKEFIQAYSKIIIEKYEDNITISYKYEISYNEMIEEKYEIPKLWFPRGFIKKQNEIKYS